MTKIDIISGFLGAGKTTLIKKLLGEAYTGEQVVLIENEFGEIGIDGGFLKEAGIEIREMNSGCICCSLVGDFGASLKEVIETYHPDRIVIEPSGVGKLSDVVKAVEGVKENLSLVLNSRTTVVDVNKCKMYLKNFGEFYTNQVEVAGAVILSRTDLADEAKVEACVKMVRELNEKAPIITTPIAGLSGKKLLETMENGSTLEEELLKETECEVCGGHHLSGHEHHHEHEEHGCCGHGHEGHEHGHHEHGEHGCCGHGHHEHGEHDCCEHGHGGHEHGHHEHGEHGCCGHGHGSHEHHHHHADEVFTSWGRETAKHYTREAVEAILKRLEEKNDFGTVLRAKGMLPGENEWIYFDMVPGEHEVRSGQPEYTGRICVIGSELNEEALEKLFDCKA